MENFVWWAKRVACIVFTWPIIVPCYFVLFVLGLVIVPIALGLGVDMKTLPIWGNHNGTEWWQGSKFWWYAIRNPFNNAKFLFEALPYMTWGTKDIDSTDGWCWQYRSTGGWMDMIRIGWGPPSSGLYGKKEVVLGWKLMKVEGVVFTAQFRPAWVGIVPVALALWGYWSLFAALTS